MVLSTTCLQAPSDTQPQYGSLEAIQDLNVTNTQTHTHHQHFIIWYTGVVFSLIRGNLVQASNLLLASPMSFTARQRHFNHTGGESNPQRVTLAVYLHADDALVVHAIYTAPRGEREEDREEDKTQTILSFIQLSGYLRTKTSW